MGNPLGAFNNLPILYQYLVVVQRGREPGGLVPKGVREVTVPPDSPPHSWSEIVEVAYPTLQPHEKIVSSVKKNGTVSLAFSLIRRVKKGRNKGRRERRV